MRFPLVVALLAAAAPVSAARAEGCANAVSQSAMNVCADQAFKRTDAALNTAYGRIMDRLDGDAATTGLLVAAQRAWLAFRDAECAFTASASAEGSVYPMVVARCREGLTGARVNELKAYLDCEEGDLSCPVPAQ